MLALQYCRVMICFTDHLEAPLASATLRHGNRSVHSALSVNLPYLMGLSWRLNQQSIKQESHCQI